MLEREEEPTKIFKTKESEHAPRKGIKLLKVGDNIVSGLEQIERKMVSFYRNLFKARIS